MTRTGWVTCGVTAVVLTPQYAVSLDHGWLHRHHGSFVLLSFLLACATTAVPALVLVAVKRLPLPAPVRRFARRHAPSKRTEDYR